MVNPPNVNSPKGSYAQVTASPKPSGRTIMSSHEVIGRTRGKPSKTSTSKKIESTESENVNTIDNEYETLGATKQPDASPKPTVDKAQSESQVNEGSNDTSTLENQDSEARPVETSQKAAKPEETPTVRSTSPGNRYSNLELPELPRPKSRKNNRKERKGTKKSPPASTQAIPFPPNIIDKQSTLNVSESPVQPAPQTDNKNEDDQLTPKASAQDKAIDHAMSSDAKPSNPQTQSPPRIPYEAKGKGKATPLSSDAPRTLIIARGETIADPPLKRKFEDTPSKVKQPARPVDFYTSKRQSEHEEPVVQRTYTVDAFTHPSEREEVYADDPEPGVLPDPAYFNETPPFLRYPQDAHLKDLAKLMTSKDVFAGDDFEHRKEGMRLQELARSAGARLHLSDSESDNGMQVDDHHEPRDQPTSHGGNQEREISFPPSPTPQPRQRRPLLPSLNRERSHSSQGIPVSHLFTREYEWHYPTQYTRSLGTRSPRGSDNYNQNASEASYTSSNLPSLPSGDYPGIFPNDVEMRDDSPAPPYHGSNTSQDDHDGQHQPPPQTHGGTEGQNDPLRTWVQTDSPGVEVNARDVKITSTPPNGWPDIFIRYLPEYDINEASRRLIEMAEGPSACYVLPFKCSQSKMVQLATLDGIRNTVSNLVTLQPGQRVGVTPMRTKSQDNEETQESRFAPPHFVLVNGLNVDQKEYLVEKHAFFVDKDISFLVYPMEIKRDLFVGTIAGLHYTKNDSEIVLDIVRQTFADQRELKTIMANGLPNYTPANFNRLIDNLRITFVSIGEEGKWNHIRGWNVILPQHDMDQNTTGVFTKVMRHTTFTVLGFGTGIFMDLDDIPLCDGCKSLGHDWQDCPFPKLAGWRGPPPAEKKKKTNVPHDQHDWFNTEDNSAGPSSAGPNPHRPSNANNQRGRNASGRGGQHRGRGNMRRNGRGGRRY